MANGVFRAPLDLSAPLFLYGTLCDPDLFEIVSGVPLEARAAVLRDVEIQSAHGQGNPVPVEAPGGVAEGVLVDVGSAARARLEFYLSAVGYARESRTVVAGEASVQAAVFVPVSEQPVGEVWSLTEWQARHGDLARLTAREFMGLMATHGPEDAARAYPQVRSRAASTLRAMADPSPEVLAPFMGDREIRPQRTDQPYTDYFAVREDWLAFPRFDGGASDVVKRASFLGGDAVTVLPFDPAQGTVLMVRQFRHGPFARGDSNPWTLEPAAGRIDPGETPEETAQRELMEETGVAADALHFTGRYYPTPGAFSEYLYSYVAVADLSGVDGGVGGLDSEHEDIMRHVLPLEEALGMIETGAINTGPLILSLFWLQLNRDRLG